MDPQTEKRIKILNELGKQAADGAAQLRDDSNQKAILADHYDDDAATLFALAQELGGE